MSLHKMARNPDRDSVLELFSPYADRILSCHWDVFVDTAGFNRLVRGEKDGGLLRFYSLLRPTVFEGFASATLASACIKETMIWHAWAKQGVKWEAAPDHLLATLRYMQHEQGDRVTIYYASEEPWSKTFRDRAVAAGDKVCEVIDLVTAAIATLFTNEPLCWMGNKDLPDDYFEQVGMKNANRLPNTPHGRNDFQGLHNVAVLSALNPPPAHYSFLDWQGINSQQVRAANYKTAVYQAVMRCSIRNPADATPKRVVVMDRETADWLADLFPGATVLRLPGMECLPQKGKAGRKCVYSTDAERKQASRARRVSELFTDLDAINGATFAASSYRLVPPSPADKATDSGHDIPSKEGNYVTRSAQPSGGTVYTSIWDRTPLAHVEHESDDVFIAFLRDTHWRQIGAKEEAGVFAPAHFEPSLDTDTDRGLANVCHLRGIWLDNDSGDLSPKEFVSFLPHLRIVVWNTYSHTPERPRWRAFIPTTLAMSIDVHRVIMGQIERVLEKNGFWSPKKLDANPRIKSRKTHGFDASKFNAASLFYLPSQAKSPEHSFFIDHADRGRGPLDIVSWIEHSITELADLEECRAPVPQVREMPASTAPAASGSGAILALRKALEAEAATSQAGRRQAIIDKAVDAWRSTPKGYGHDAFFRLAATLRSAGLDDVDLRVKLHEEAASGSNPKERRSEIKGILKSLRQSGRFWQ